jgi:hypothetical protein
MAQDGMAWRHLSTEQHSTAKLSNKAWWRGEVRSTTELTVRVVCRKVVDELQDATRFTWHCLEQ